MERMIRKRPALKKVTSIEGLAELMVGEFARTDERFDRIDERFTQVDERFDRVETRLDRIEEQLVSINGELRSVRMEIKEINRRLDALERSAQSARGHAVEIDELRARVKRMEDFLKSQGLTMPR